VPPQATDCHGNVFTIDDHVPHGAWRRQTDRVRSELRHDFDRLTLLADASDVGGMVEGGFDGMAIYDNFVRPSTWRALAEMVSVRDLVFSFNANPGYDGIHLRTVEADSCYVPTPIEPPGAYDWASSPDRDIAARQSRARIQESFIASTAVQADTALANARRRFFLLYVNSFNEWHEGHQFEPMKDAAALTADERKHHYRNPTHGDYRMVAIEGLVRQLVDGDSRHM
jgi:hypothetical protein